MPEGERSGSQREIREGRQKVHEVEVFHHHPHYWAECRTCEYKSLRTISEPWAQRMAINHRNQTEAASRFESTLSHNGRSET